MFRKLLKILLLATLVVALLANCSFSLGDYQSLSLDGNGYASITDAAQQGLNMGLSDFMIEGWVKTSSATRQSLFHKIAASAGYQITLYGNISGQIEWWIKDGVTAKQDETSGVNYIDGRRHYIIFVADRSGNGSFFIDGTQSAASIKNMSAVGDIDNAGDFQFGYNGINYFTGLLDEIRIWNFGYGGLPADYATYIAWRYTHPSHPLREYSAGAWNGYVDAYRIERITYGALDDDNGDFEGAGPDGTGITTTTDWMKNNTSAEIDDEAGSGVTTYNGSTFCAKIHTAIDDSPAIMIYGVNLDAAFVVGDWYELSFDYKILNCTNAKIHFYNAGNIVSFYINLTSVSWTTSKTVFQLLDNNDVGMYCYSHSGTDETGDEVVWIDNISIKRIGLVAHYPFDGTYDDETSNSNDLSSGGSGNIAAPGMTPTVITEGVIIN